MGDSVAGLAGGVGGGEFAGDAFEPPAETLGDDFEGAVDPMLVDGVGGEYGGVQHDGADVIDEGLGGEEIIRVDERAVLHEVAAEDTQDGEQVAEVAEVGREGRVSWGGGNLVEGVSGGFEGVEVGGLPPAVELVQGLDKDGLLSGGEVPFGGEFAEDGVKGQVGIPAFTEQDKVGGVLGERHHAVGG